MDQMKNYLVIGGSSGIGLAIAQRLAEEGGRVIIASGNESKLKAAAATLKGEGHLTCCCDLSQPEQTGKIFAFLKEQGIVLHGMVYSAGIAPLCLLKDHTRELRDKVYNINFFSFLEAVQYFYSEEYSYEETRIVAISSITARGSGYRQTLYGSSKAAMISAVKLMARELLNRKIRINCISPGVADTPILDELRKNSANFDEKLKVNQPLGAVPPESVAEVAAHLITGGSDYLTGMEWVLDGGAMLK